MGSYIKIQVPIVSMGLILLVFLLPKGLAVAWAGVVSWIFGGVPLYLYVFNRGIGIDLGRPILRLARPLLITAIMIVVLRLLEQLAIFPPAGWLRLVCSVAVGGGTYLFVCLLVQHEEIMKIISFARSIATTQHEKTIAVTVE